MINKERIESKKKEEGMSREVINEKDLAQVAGGSIVFNSEHTQCGRDRNDEYRVLDYDKVIEYIAKNRFEMTERTMLRNMASLGYLESM